MRSVFADTNVLFPFSVMDVLLALSEDRVHKVLWTDALLDEWVEVIVREHRRTPELASNLAAVVREFFAEDRIERHEYEHLISEMSGEDPDDYEHMAAVVARQPCTLLTHDRDGFPVASWRGEV
ncbi:MAG: PIN domain-containing protein [Ilumatobacteraceae bacterium]